MLVYQRVYPFPNPQSFFRKKLRLLSGFFVLDESGWSPNPACWASNKSQGTPNYDGDDESGQPITREYIYIICIYIYTYVCVVYMYISIYVIICMYVYLDTAYHEHTWIGISQWSSQWIGKVLQQSSIEKMGKIHGFRLINGKNPWKKMGKMEKKWDFPN